MTMTREKIEELKRLAEKATQGEWTFFGKQNEIQIKDNVGCLLARMSWHHSNRYDYTLQEESVANAKFIAAANPQTILSLLALAERALEPQGQALPELPEPVQDVRAMFRGEVDSFVAMDIYITGEQAKKYGQECYDAGRASQLALPAGPVPEAQALANAKSALYAIAKTLNDSELRAHALQAYEEISGGQA